MSRLLAALAAISLVAACGEKPAPAPAPAPPAVPSPPATPAAEPAAPAVTPAPAAAPAPTPAPAAKPSPAPAATTPPPAATPTPPPAATPTAAPAPAPAAAGRTAVGPDRCKACHRIQHSSWLAGGHPAKGVDCEFCHGPGSDYVPIKIMKDPVAARAAGLVMPGKDRCLPCHAAKWSDDMLAKAHAHKPK